MSIDLSPLGFRKTPFTRELTVAERCPLPAQDEAATALAAVVQQRMSAALIAAPGVGKTVALRLLRSKLPEARFQVRYVKVTGLSKRDLCKEIAVACGLEPAGIYPALVRKLQDAIIHTGNDGLRPVILFDEAHDLRPEALAMLRLLTNFEMDSRLVVSVILCGQLDSGGGSAPQLKLMPSNTLTPPVPPFRVPHHGRTRNGTLHAILPASPIALGRATQHHPRTPVSRRSTQV